MEKRRDLRSVLPIVPLILRSSSLCWPPLALEALKALSRGPAHSNVVSGEALFDAIIDLRHRLGFSGDRLAGSAGGGYAVYFNKLLPSVDSRRWFEEFVPSLACLLLRLPSLLETHYQEEEVGDSLVSTRFRVLASQEAGVVSLSQELTGALLACSFFCLFPDCDRYALELPIINFDYLFAGLCHSRSPSQENKIKCLMHYFERICMSMPQGFISFERKVLSLNNNSSSVPYPEVQFWGKSAICLCPLKVLHTGKIEDQQQEALEVDFANKFLGGGALHRGCVQEEIRFMISPELIVGMLFLPSMADNEALEIVGTERFSNYTGYSSTFLFSASYIDQKAKDAQGRRRTRIVAIDALSRPGVKQFEIKCLLRETNKAFCGFMDQSKCQQYCSYLYEDALYMNQPDQDENGIAFDAEDILVGATENSATRLDIPILSSGPILTCSFEKNSEGSSFSGHINACGKEKDTRCCDEEPQSIPVSHAWEGIGIATGNWGCGAFGGDPEVKCMIQWLAASQALRPFILYYTFGEPTLQRLQQVTEWILDHNWTVGDLWNMVAEYSRQRLNGVRVGFLDWVLPSGV